MSVRALITEHLDLWASAVTKKASSGRGSRSKVELTGVKKLRELILELAVRGELVSQDRPTESSSDLIAVMEREKAKLVNSKRIKRPKVVGSVSQENHPFDIPDNWSWHSLGALGYTQTGSTPAKSQSKLFGSDIPFLKPGDISESGEICYDNEGLSEAGKEVLGKWAEKDSILMVCIGTIGKCGLIEQQCTFNQQINSVTPFVPEISQFLFLCLRSPYFQSAAWEKSSSTTISILNKGKWESIPVPLPPLEEQQRIVQKVDELIALCDRLEQQTSDQLEAHETLVDTLLGTLTQSETAIELADNWARLAAHFDTLFTTEQSIDKLKQTILQLAVMGRLVEKDAEDEPAVDLLTQIHTRKVSLAGDRRIKQPRPLAQLDDAQYSYTAPAHWAWASFQDVADEISTGPFGSMIHKHDYVEGGIPLINPSHMANGKINEDSSVSVSPPKAEELSGYKLVKGDIVMARRGEVGRCAVVTDRESGWLCGTGSFVLRFHPAINRQFILLLFSTNTVREYLSGNSVGTTMTNLNHGILKKMPVALPPAKEQHRIVQKVDELMTLCDQLTERLNLASETRCQLAEAVVEGALN